MSDAVFIKEYLRRINYKYLSVEENEDIKHIRFTYDDRNYVIHIDTKEQIITIEHVDSLYFGELEPDIKLIVNDIQRVLVYTDYAEYEVCIVSNSNIGPKEGGYAKKLEILNDNFEGVSIDALEEYEKLDGSIIEYGSGLNTFDDRLFEDNWLEDFNIKVKSYSEKDLFLIITTLTAYFYKATSDKWKDKVIDPFTVSHALGYAIDEAKKYFEGSNYTEWYESWDKYFTDDRIEEYLKSKVKSKEKRSD